MEATKHNVGQFCLSEDDCIAQGINFAAYERGIADAAEAFDRNRKASLASAPAGFNHSIGAERFTTVRGAYWWHVRAGDGTQNIGKFHTKLAAEDMALTLLTAFRDGAFMQYGAMLASAPTPPVSDDRKDAELWRDLVSHQKFNNVPAVGYAINQAKKRQAMQEGKS